MENRLIKNEVYLYENITSLQIDLPQNIHLLSKLKDMVVRGTRFWNLTMEKVPTNVRELTLDILNLSSNYYRGIEKLVNLKHLSISVDFETISQYDYINNTSFCNYRQKDDIKPLPFVPQLERITILIGFGVYKKDEKNLIDCCQNCMFLINYRKAYGKLQINYDEKNCSLIVKFAK